MCRCHWFLLGTTGKWERRFNWECKELEVEVVALVSSQSIKIFQVKMGPLLLTHPIVARSSSPGKNKMGVTSIS